MKTHLLLTLSGLAVGLGAACVAPADTDLDETASAAEPIKGCGLDCPDPPPPPPDPTPLPACNGNHVCDAGETCDSCPTDCGACPTPAPVCGDHACNGTETCSTCPQDCGACPVQTSYALSLDMIHVMVRRSGLGAKDTDYIVLGVSYPNNPYSGPSDYTTVTHAVYVGTLGEGVHIYDPAINFAGYDNRSDGDLNGSEGNVDAQKMYHDGSCCADEATSCNLGAEYDTCATSGGARANELPVLAFKGWSTGTPIYVSYLVVNSSHQDLSSSSRTLARTEVKRCNLEPFMRQQIDPTSPSNASYYGPSAPTYASYRDSFNLASMMQITDLSKGIPFAYGLLTLFAPGLFTLDCDGLVAASMQQTSGNEIAATIAQSPAHAAFRVMDHPGLDSPWTCGATSDYVVGTSIRALADYNHWLAP